MISMDNLMNQLNKIFERQQAEIDELKARIDQLEKPKSTTNSKQPRSK